MVKCPRCEFPVDETTRTTCPLCFTPITVAGGEAQVPTPPQAPVPAEQPPVAQPPAVPMMPPAVSMPPSQQQMPPQQGYAPPPPQVQQMPGMQQTQQGGGMPQAAPPPQPHQYTPGSVPRPGVRVSLTGEVIDDSMGSSTPTPSYVGNTLPPPRPVGPAAGGARRPVREEAPNTTQGNPVAVVILVVMLLVGLGAGGWWFMSHRTNPKDQATKFFTALQKQDWKTMYTVVELSDEDKKRLPDAEAFEKDAKEKIASSPFGSQMLTGLKDIKFTTGEAKIEGDTATVPITLKANVMGQEQSVNMPIELVNKGGWKVKQGGIGVGGNGGGMGGGGMMGRGMMR